jgi:hypothetical protein
MAITINELDNRSIDDLLELVGTELMGRNAAADPKSQVIDRARRWLRQKLATLHPAICGSEVVKQVLESSDRVALITAVADVIAGLIVGVSPVTVAAILTKLGLKRLCSGEGVEV